MAINSGKGRRSKEKRSILRESNQIMYLRAIQGHSGDNAVDLTLKDNVLFPKGFTMYICHVENANKLNEEQASREEDKQSSSPK